MAVCAVSSSAATLKKPTKVKAVNGEKTIQVTWAKVKGAKKYKVYRNKKVVKTTTKTSFKDFSIFAGKAYTYKVKAYKGKTASKASKSVKVTRINYSIIKNISNGDKKVTLNWTKRTGANQYRVYRKTTGSYVKVNTSTGLSYVDTKVTSGTKYSYKILCYNTKTKTASMFSTAASTTYLDKVTGVFARENTDGKSISVKWNATKGAASYDVYRIKAAEETYTKIASTSSTSYTDSKLSNNPTAYMYRIVAVKNGSSSVDSDSPVTGFAPKRDGVNSYYYDDNNNFHVIVKLNKGDTYAEGKALSDFYSLSGLYTAEVTSGADVIALNDSVITANNSGMAVIEVKLSPLAGEIVSALNNPGLTNIYNRTVGKTAYVEVEVA